MRSVQSGCGYVRKNVGTSASTSRKRSAEAVASGSAPWPAECVVAEGQFVRVVDEQQRAVEGRLALTSLDFRAELLANELRARAKLNPVSAALQCHATTTRCRIRVERQPRRIAASTRY